MTFLRVTEVTAGAPGDLRPPPPMPERGAGGARRPIHTAALNTPPHVALGSTVVRPPPRAKKSSVVSIGGLLGGGALSVAHDKHDDEHDARGQHQHRPQQ